MTTNREIECGYCRRTLPKKRCKRHTYRTVIKKERYYSQEHLNQAIREAKRDVLTSLKEYLDKEFGSMYIEHIMVDDTRKVIEERLKELDSTESSGGDK